MHPVCEYAKLLRINTVLYFQPQSKTNAGEMPGGVQNIAAKCEWLVQVVEGPPPPKRLKAKVEFWRPVGAIVECGGAKVRAKPNA